MHRQDIRAHLGKRYGSMADFERAKGLPSRSVRDVLRGRAVAQAERALSDELGKPLHVLFPLRYEEPEGDETSPNGDNTRSSSSEHRLIAGRR